MKKHMQSALLLSLSLLLLAVAYARSEERVIRMHVIARSDAENDQNMKRQVRDALLPLVNAALADSDRPVEALEALLPALRYQAENIAHSPVTVTLSKESYPARFDSGSFLPAGRYTALRVTLGEGSGHNWWGVVYPEEEEETELHWWIIDWWRSRREHFPVFSREKEKNLSFLS